LSNFVLRYGSNYLIIFYENHLVVETIKLLQKNKFIKVLSCLMVEAAFDGGFDTTCFYLRLRWSEDK
jgi:hypothetical protein